VAKPTGDATTTVGLALAANVCVGVLKLAAGLISGSGALLSEAAHSAGDTATELLLVVALRRSGHPADRSHPFGYGKERYFWSLLAALAIFVTGSGFSFFEGIRTVLSPAADTTWLWINYPVLAFAAVLEAVSFRQAARQLGREASQRKRSIADYIRAPEDTTVNSVAIEDSTALVGICVATAGVALHQITGDPIWDGIASLLIGALLLTAAFLLARACAGLLIGRQASPVLVSAIEDWLERQAEVDDVVDLLTMMTGANRVLLCARVDFDDSLSAGRLEHVCARLDDQLRAEFDELDEIFLQPASRSDPKLRRRVQDRYGTALTDR
jgi:cation diffusion facilitator family transporter